MYHFPFAQVVLLVHLTSFGWTYSINFFVCGLLVVTCNQNSPSFLFSFQPLISMITESLATLLGLFWTILNGRWDTLNDLECIMLTLKTLTGQGLQRIPQDSLLKSSQIMASLIPRAGQSLNVDLHYQFFTWPHKVKFLRHWCDKML